MDLKQAINTQTLDDNQTLAKHIIIRHANLNPDSALDQDLCLRVEVELDRYALQTYSDVLQSVERVLEDVEQLINNESYKYSDNYDAIQGNGYLDNLTRYAMCIYKRGKYLNAYNVIESWVTDYHNEICFMPHEQDSLASSYADLTIFLPEYQLDTTHGCLYVMSNGDIEIWGLCGHFKARFDDITAETSLNGIRLAPDKVLRIAIPADGSQWTWEVI